MKFIVDAQLPPALAHVLINLGHEAQHVFEIELAQVFRRREGWINGLRKTDFFVAEFTLEHIVTFTVTL